MSNQTNTQAVNAENELLELEKQIMESTPAVREEQTEQLDNSESKQAEEQQTSESESATDESNNSADEESESEDLGKSEDEGSEDDEDMSQLSDKAQKRIRDLARRAKDAEAKLLEERKARLLAQPGIGQKPVQAQETDSGMGKDLLPWNGESEVTPEQYEAAVTERATSIVRGELAKEKMLANLRSDTHEIEQQYPELNPDSEAYDDELAVDIAADFKVLHQANPQLRLKEYVDRRLKYKAKWSSQAKADVTAKIVKQAATQPISPNATKPTPKQTVEDRVKNVSTLQELEALEREIGIADK